MIKLNSPSIGINDWGATFKIQMDWTAEAKSTFVDHHVFHIIRLFKNHLKVDFPGKPVEHLVLNCIGDSGSISIGNRGFNGENIFMFNELKGSIKRVWILNSDTSSGEKGYSFCSQLAKIMNCTVIAPVFATKELFRNFPKYMIPDLGFLFEIFGPVGDVNFSDSENIICDSENMIAEQFNSTILM